MKYLNNLIITSALIGSSVAAEPLDSCPAPAFLIQDSVAKLYEVDLLTGATAELSSSMATSGKLNAMGFNFADNYLYAYSNEFQDIVKIGRDYQVQPLAVSNLPDRSFYVGDVHLNENSYFMYRPGSSYGLYKVNLDASLPDYLNAVKIVDGATLNLAIYDFAFHPTTDLLYAVDRNGNLHQIDINTLQVKTLSNVGQSGTFGAAYFDADGWLYISRNSDGYIYRIDVAAESPSAEFFAYGPASSNNDGARCAMAEIFNQSQTQVQTVDFGNAPASYGISVEDNGPRHLVSETLYLGSEIGGNGDGVEFATGLLTGLDSIVLVEAVGEGYLNAWVDWNQNGQFDLAEQVVTDQSLTTGENIVVIDVPADAVQGNTWARFRYSTTAAIGPKGGVSDGEVEDIEIDVTKENISVIHYPSSQGMTSVAFEDKWPALGDFDMNDVVATYRVKQYVNELNQVIRYDIIGSIIAVGAQYHNGFAVQLDGISTSNVNQAQMRYELNDLQQLNSALEANAANDDAVVIIAQDVWQHLEKSQDCGYYRTQVGCDEVNHLSFLITVPLVNPVELAQAPSGLLNPFIFATPDKYHGSMFVSPPGRGLEVHLKNKKVSSKFNPLYWGMNDDASFAAQGITFQNDQGLPWAVEIPELWSHPVEQVDLAEAYPEFIDYVLSAGNQNKTWYRQNKARANRIIINR